MFQLAKQSSTKVFNVTFSVLIGVFLTACGGTTSVQSDFSTSTADEGLDQLISSTLEQEKIINTVLLVDSPDHGYRYLNAGGLANPDTQEAMTPQHAFRLASITKSFVATVVLQLMEEGYLALDTPLSEILEDQDLPSEYTLDELHHFEGQTYGRQITVRQLLQHTSGMRDFMTDGATDNIPQAEQGLIYQSAGDVLEGNTQGLANQQWTSMKLLSYYLDGGYGDNALSPPGLTYHYSDSGYLLLGVIVEKLTGQSLTDNLRQRIFDPLNLNNTYHEHYEIAHGEAIAHHFFDLGILNLQGNIDIETLDINTSASWAGGGIVSTVEDQLTFFKALFRGDLFRDSSTLTAMKGVTAVSPNYGLGLQTGTFNGYTVWGHAGYWGTAAACSPEKNICVAVATNQVNSNIFEVGGKAFKALLDAEQ